jgi:molybdate/tungstate transport system permease protein
MSRAAFLLNGRLRLAAIPAAIALILLGSPFVTLILVTRWGALALLPGDLAAVGVSLSLSVISILLVLGLGTPLAWLLAQRGWPRGWRPLAEAILLLALLTPPLAMGILLAALYGPAGPAGRLLMRAGWLLANNPAAFVLAQFYGAAPYFILAARAAFQGVPRELEQVARGLGRGPLSVFCAITLPLAAVGLGAGLALAWVRAMGEFGIVLVMAYFPQGMPVKLWVDLQDAGVDKLYPLLWLFLLVSLPLPLALSLRLGVGHARRAT